MDTGGQVIQLQQTSQVLNGKYRRNRKLQSCEPCRKSKLGCDHHVPCSRCIRRRCVDSCYYHPNPLTRDRQGTTVDTTTTTMDNSIPKPIDPSSSSTSQSLVLSVEQLNPNALATSQWHNGRADPGPHRACSAPPWDSRCENSPEHHGFLGFTSHSSIMTEDLLKLGVPSNDLRQATPVRKMVPSNDRITRGCQILSFFQNKTMIDRGIDLFFKTIDGVFVVCGEFIIRNWLSQLWLAYGDTLSGQNPEKIRQLCEQLCENTATPLKFDGMTTAKEWVYSATGIHIRWAVLAMIANYVGTYVMFAKSSDTFCGEFNIERNSFLIHVAEVSDECMSFCRECNALDDAFIWALLENHSFAVGTKGEADYASYRISAEVNSALVVLGLHQEIKADERVPFFLAELRKRLRAMVYTAEIGVAAFLGRPSRLSYRYINLNPPLDLKDSQLFSEDPEELAAAMARLDESGYNRDGELSYVCWLRSWINFAMRREDILELALGNYTPEEVRKNGDAIHQKTEEYWATLPRFLSSLRHDGFELGTQNLVDLHFRTLFRHGPQANNLLLHRVLMRKAGTGPTELIRTAQTILSDVMRTYKRIEMSAAAAAAASLNIIYFLFVHGVRSAAILAIELLKQEQLPSYPKEPLLPRSKTIQDLSVFTAKLAVMESGFRYIKLYEQGREVISRILDKILSPSSATDLQSYQTQTQQLNTRAVDNDILQSVNVSESYPTMNDFSYVTDMPIFGPDHDFRQWLEIMESQDWEHFLQL